MPDHIAPKHAGSTPMSLFLIDSDVRRRAAICHALVGSGLYVDPFDFVSFYRQRLAQTQGRPAGTA